jgi:4'-phosphopantetheinyl transferase
MASPLMWREPPAHLTLATTDLHVWQVPLDRSAEEVTRFQARLAADELARADRFYFERDRRRYIVTRGALRTILGRYLDRGPESLHFAYAAKGKPYLPDVPLYFNVAHSHDLALCAIALADEVGVDVEYTPRPVSDIDHIAARFFSANENAIYRTLPPAERRAAFFRCWTRKEAFIKALGEGLSHPLDRFDVTLTDDQSAAVLQIDGDAVAAAAWTLLHLDPADEYVGAVAIKMIVQRLDCWRC